MTNKHPYPSTLIADFYKLSHRVQYPTGTEKIYSTWTPRSNKYFSRADKVVMFGVQAFVKKYLIEHFNEHFFNRQKEDVLSEYKRVVKYTLGINEPEVGHLEALHELGYLPIRLKGLKEGTLVPIKTPMITIENTEPEFFWLTNYLETIMSNEIWLPMTSATTSFEFRKILDKYAMETVGHTDDVGVQLHDFSMRGMSSFDASKASGAAHLLSFTGTDTIPAILYHEEFYNANIESEFVAGSISATEHSCMSAMTSADGDRDEYKAFKRLITEVYPSGFVSIVSDTYDFWDVIENTLPRLKEDIMKREGRVIIRPDSGSPADIICGKSIEDISKREWINSLEDAKAWMKQIVKSKVENETPHSEEGDYKPTGEFKYNGKYYRIELDVSWNRYDKQYYYMDGASVSSFEEFVPTVEDMGLVESLYNLFGGYKNELGYKVLDSHIGCIYGDSITIEVAEEICGRLKEKGFASTNATLGAGSMGFQLKTRDSLGFAMKATYAVVNGEERLLFKDPKTDDGTKRSQRGLVYVQNDEEENLHYKDGLNRAKYDKLNSSSPDLLEVVFEDGKLLRDESLSEIRKRLKSQ